MLQVLLILGVLAVYIDMCGKKVERANDMQVSYITIYYKVGRVFWDASGQDKLNASGQKRGIEHLSCVVYMHVLAVATRRVETAQKTNNSEIPGLLLR